MQEQQEVSFGLLEGGGAVAPEKFADQPGCLRGRAGPVGFVAEPLHLRKQPVDFRAEMSCRAAGGDLRGPLADASSGEPDACGLPASAAGAEGAQPDERAVAPRRH